MLEKHLSQLPKLRQRIEFTPTVEGWIFRDPKVSDCIWDAVDVTLLVVHTETATSLFQPHGSAETLTLQLRSMTAEARDVISIEFAHPEKGLCPRGLSAKALPPKMEAVTLKHLRWQSYRARGRDTKAYADHIENGHVIYDCRLSRLLKKS